MHQKLHLDFHVKLYCKFKTQLLTYLLDCFNLIEKWISKMGINGTSLHSAMLIYS